MTAHFGADWGVRTIVRLNQLVVERYEDKPGVFYQRPLSSKKAMEISENFYEVLFGLPVVTEIRKGVFAVLDGATRCAALHLMGMTEVPVLLLPKMNMKQRAQVFHELNTLRKTLRAIDKFRASHAVGDIAHVEIIDTMNKYTIVATEGSTGVNAIAAVGATLKVWNMGGTTLFDRTLSVITKSWPKDKQRLTGDVLLGVSTFLHRDKHRTSDANVVARLASMRVSQLLKSASDLREGHGHGGGSPVYFARAIAISIYGADAINDWPYS